MAVSPPLRSVSTSLRGPRTLPGTPIWYPAGLRPWGIGYPGGRESVGGWGVYGGNALAGTLYTLEPPHPGYGTCWGPLSSGGTGGGSPGYPHGRGGINRHSPMGYGYRFPPPPGIYSLYATVPWYHGGYHSVPYMVLPLLLVLYGLWVSYMYTPVPGPIPPHTLTPTPHPRVQPGTPGTGYPKGWGGVRGP